jgi:ABC-type multidrug transport system ATPase subunit
MTKRIGFLGGPGSGKSTTAAWLFAELKTQNKPVELCNEYVKAWTYLNRAVKEWDQVYCFAKQQQYEFRFLQAGKHVIHIDGTLKEKDCIRMKEIKELMGCKFFRYNEKNQELKEY